jgi:arginase
MNAHLSHHPSSLSLEAPVRFDAAAYRRSTAVPAHPGPLALVGVPFGLGAGVRGTELAPAATRLSGLGEALAALGHAVVDRGDAVPVMPAEADAGPLAETGRHGAAVAAWVHGAHRAVRAALEDGQRPIMIGGDHSLSIGSVTAARVHAAARGRRLAVLWIDAHADFNTPATSPSGNLHGMSVACLTGEPTLARLVPDPGFAPLAPSDITIFGARSIDRDEKSAIAGRGLGCLDMRAIDAAGVCALLGEVLAGIDPATTDLHVSFDLDVLDPALAPGVGTPVMGGLSYREAHLVMELLHESGLVTSLDVVELNPMLDHAGQTARLAVDLVGSLFGKSISQPALGQPARTAPLAVRAA